VNQLEGTVTDGPTFVRAVVTPFDVAVKLGWTFAAAGSTLR
jgi:hypothetical protein